jgi:Kyakuja-Dileera-Zisupton transposase
MNAANRFASAGRSQKSIKPSTKTYVGELADVVRDDFANSRLVSLAQERQKRATALQVEDETQGLLAACSTALTCNRPVSSATRGELDQYGMVSVVCSHVIPGLGLSVPMLTYEQHYYYDVVLGDVLKRRPDLSVIYLDLACRYAKGRWKVLLNELVTEEQITQQQRDRVQLLLPWMHAFDHDVECQLQYSALYKVRSYCFVYIYMYITSLQYYCSSAHAWHSFCATLNNKFCRMVWLVE